MMRGSIPIRPVFGGRDPPRTAFGDRRAITPQSQVRICSPPLETAVSKSPDRGVIRRASGARRWPLRVLGPMLATSYDDGLPVAVSVIDSPRLTLADLLLPPRPVLVPNSLQSRSSRRPGYRGLFPLNRSQPLHIWLPFVRRPPATSMSTRSAGCHLSNKPLPQRAVGILKAKMAKWSLWHPGWGVREPGVSKGR